METPTHSDEMPEVLTAREVADYLKVNIKTVYEISRSGDLPAAKLGRVFRYHRDQVIAFAQGKVVPLAHKNGKLQAG